MPSDEPTYRVANPMLMSGLNESFSTMCERGVKPGDIFLALFSIVVLYADSCGISREELCRMVTSSERVPSHAGDA